MTWDTYFHSLCIATAAKSPCLSRKIGALLVKDHSVISMGYNGPARGVPHCGKDRFLKDNYLVRELQRVHDLPTNTIGNTCPRRILSLSSGEGMEWCPAVHAEINAIANAARKGASTIGTTLYMNAPVPCRDCLPALINAGIVELVVEDLNLYDKYSKFTLENSTLKLRKFVLED